MQDGSKQGYKTNDRLYLLHCSGNRGCVIDTMAGVRPSTAGQPKERYMKLNMGVIDRVLRVLIALVIGVLYWQNIISGTLGIVLLVLGGVFVLTSLVGFCPLYLPLKLSTKND